MRKISSEDAKKDLDKLLDELKQDSILIRRGGKDAGVLVSPEEYERLRQLMVSGLKDFCDRVSDGAKAEGMTEDVLKELLKDD